MNTSSTSASSWGKVFEKRLPKQISSPLIAFPFSGLICWFQRTQGGISVFLASTLCANNSSKTQKQGSPWDASTPCLLFLSRHSGLLSVFQLHQIYSRHPLCSILCLKCWAFFFFPPGSFFHQVLAQVTERETEKVSNSEKNWRRERRYKLQRAERLGARRKKIQEKASLIDQLTKQTKKSIMFSLTLQITSQCCQAREGFLWLTASLQNKLSFLISTSPQVGSRAGCHLPKG